MLTVQTMIAILVLNLHNCFTCKAIAVECLPWGIYTIYIQMEKV